MEPFVLISTKNSTPPIRQLGKPNEVRKPRFLITYLCAVRPKRNLQHSDDLALTIDCDFIFPSSKRLNSFLDQVHQRLLLRTDSFHLFVRNTRFGR